MKQQTVYEQLPLNKFGFNLGLDLDGLIADFDEGFKNISGLCPKDFLTSNKKSEFWKIVNSKPDFFYCLEKTKEADEIWNVFKDYDPFFLTGAPSGFRAKSDKIQWVKEKFGEQYITIVLPKKDKKFFSGSHRILIDDTEQNIIEWKEYGGIGILHRGDAKETIKNFEEAIAPYISNF